MLISTLLKIFFKIPSFKSNLSQSLEMYLLTAEKLDFKIENILYLKKKLSSLCECFKTNRMHLKTSLISLK